MDIQNLGHQVKEYTQIQKSLLELNTTEKAAKVFSKIAFASFILIMLLLTVVFLSLAGAAVINNLTGSLYLGYILMALLLSMGAVATFKLGKEKITNTITLQIINLFYAS